MILFVILKWVRVSAASPSHTADSIIEEIKATAIELQDLVQAKVGTTKFSQVYSQIRQKTLELQHNRKVARALLVTTNPEAAAKRKQQRNVIKKESRKRKDRGFA